MYWGDSERVINHDGQYWVGLEDGPEGGVNGLGKHEWITNLDGFMTYLNKWVIVMQSNN